MVGVGSSALGDGQYTAQATQASSLGNAEGKTAAVEFEVFTKAPAVVFTKVPTERSKQTKPVFEGTTTAAETEQVTVHVYEGSGTSGKEVVGLKVTPSAGKWSVSASSALANGLYTAQATQVSSLGNAEGKTAAVEFEVFSGAAALTITHGPAERSKQNEPTFEGTVTAGETEQVTVHIYEGAGTSGKEVVGLKASPSGGKWAVTATTALGDGEYTAQATQPSSIGNTEAKSEPPIEFEIFTKPPTVKFTHTPEPRSNKTKPSFEGTTTPGETGQVTVHVYQGAGTSGKEVGALKATPASGKWSAAATTALPEGKYTAQATQLSSIENGEGKSELVEFEVVAGVPMPLFTKVPAARSDQTKPAFEGATSAQETEPVMVHIYQGSGTSGKEAASLKAAVSAGKWSVSASSALANGVYTAQATQASSVGNGEGKSEAVEFEVFSGTAALVITHGPEVRSKQNKPTFEGTSTAGESEPVTVHVYEGSGTAGKEVVGLKASPSAGKWAVTATTGLGDGAYTAQATQPSSIGNLEAKSEPPVEFEVFTKPPTVVFKKVPAERAKQTKPSFEGEASETEPVTVHIYEGSGTAGKQLTSLKATVTEHKWHATVSTALAEGKYTAQASEPSSIGNAEGQTEPPVEFEVFGKPPAVVITHAPEARSKQTKPTFEGTTTVGETASVIVHVYEGSGTGGKEVVALTAPVSNAKWSVSVASALGEGEYTAQATQVSSLENGPGASGTVEFEVVTKPPVVVLTGLPARSKTTKPTFSGSVSEPGAVTVHVHEGSSVSGKEVGSVKVTVAKAGSWSVAASSGLTEGVYTAVAVEPSAIGNEPGESEPSVFEVVTKAPVVVFTKVPAVRSSQAKPAFEGSTTVGETEPVTVHVYEGSGTGGKEVVGLKASVSGGKWSVSASSGLADGKYTAQATQVSSLGNGPGSSEAVEFEVFTGVPTVKITHGPAERSKQNEPVFEGEASESEPVTVRVYEGVGTAGKEVATLKATPSAGKWSVAATSALGDGKYTAVAFQTSSLGNGVGESEEVGFEVFTKAPAVLFAKVPAARSKQNKPAFEGSTTPGETNQVTVHVYEGSGTGGKEVVGLKVTPSAGKWSVSASSALGDGQYTAQATQTSSLGNAEGKTAAVEFEVFTKAPAVVFTKVPTERSKQTKPVFEGTTTAAETEQVTVHVYEGSGTSGKEVVGLKVTPSAGKWSVSASSALANGLYTAQATQVSSLGNAEGKTAAVEFEVFSGAAALTITHGPAERSKQNEPTFEGTVTAGETEQVTVHIYEGAGTSGKEVVGLKASPSGGKWAVTATTALGDGEYTAQATQPSSIGNTEAKSEPPIEFEIFTKPPTVKFTHTPEPRSNKTKPSFEGEASETEPVTVHIYEGSGTGGKQLTTLKATVTEHKWHATISTALAEGKYTAQASEPSSIGNAEGETEPAVEFEVFGKPPAVVITHAPEPRSKQTKPAFEGTTTPGETASVMVHIYEGSGIGGKEVVSLTAPVSNAKWSVTATSGLADGKYTAQATQASSLGNQEGKSETREFEILTTPPVVKISHPPERRSKQNKPTFEGEASETEPVTVHVYEGSGTGGTEVVALKAAVSEHKWHVTAGVVFADGEYTARATEPSSLGNAEGLSEPVEYEIFTKPPAVKITHGPEGRSKQTKPIFEGTTTPQEGDQITVHIYEGVGTGGKEVATLKATPTNGTGTWAVTATSALPGGKYTAQATQVSSLGNPEGKSAPEEFEIFTERPAVKVTRGPEKRSKQNKPTFEGTTTVGETEPVTVHVYEGVGTGGKEVATLKATPSSGKWTVAATTAFPDGKYTAQVTQASSLGNAEGKTEAEEFEIFTKPPAVKVTTGPEKPRSKQNKPSFEGTTTVGETEPVVVHVYEGAGTGGKEVATLKATPASGKWSVAVATALVDGKYTAQATQVSSLGNAEGKTEAEEFEIFTGRRP